VTLDTTTTSVQKSIVVNAPVARAFTLFTDEMDSWWPPEHHLLKSPLAATVFEPRVGGRIIDRGVDGSECPWSRVLAYEPPTRVVFSWDIGLDWQLQTDPAKTSEVEVRFVALADGRTRVELEHRHLDRHGDGWEGMATAVGSPGGWPVGLGRFAAAAEGRVAG
jgi:uncharacterized protein YndB with AHSA1/START domain